ncbi:MAG: GNAT family N-acetyltransferase [Nitrososphaerota archaeon]
MPTDISIRVAEKQDKERIVDLMMRAKRLNEEFDPLLKLSHRLQEIVTRYVEESFTSPSSLLVVAEHGGRLVGVLKAELVNRIFYDPPLEGIIRELYILPEYRRKGVGKMLVAEAFKILQERGAGLITAEFPSLHKIAVEFYEKMGFRPIFSKYTIEIDRAKMVLE